MPEQPLNRQRSGWAREWRRLNQRRGLLGRAHGELCIGMPLHVRFEEVSPGHSSAEVRAARALHVDPSFAPFLGNSPQWHGAQKWTINRRT